MLNEFFDNIVVLTTSRRLRGEAELKMYGINAQFFRSLAYHPKKSFNMSMRTILESFLVKGGERLLILEDDVVFQNMDKVEVVFDELEMVDWEILYLGGNYHNHAFAQKPTYVSEHLRRIYNAWTTHAIAFKRNVAEDIVRRYKADELFDAWLDTHVLRQYTTIATVPMLAIQLPDYSSLWGHHVDYSDVWSRSIDFIR